jgi:hypothetical protein
MLNMQRVSKRAHRVQLHDILDRSNPDASRPNHRSSIHHAICLQGRDQFRSRSTLIVHTPRCI